MRFLLNLLSNISKFMPNFLLPFLVFEKLFRSLPAMHSIRKILSFKLVIFVLFLIIKVYALEMLMKEGFEPTTRVYKAEALTTPAILCELPKTQKSINPFSIDTFHFRSSQHSLFRSPSTNISSFNCLFIFFTSNSLSTSSLANHTTKHCKLCCFVF